MAGYTERQKSFIDAESIAILSAMNATRADLQNSLELREQYNQLMGRYVAANPQIFEPDQIATASAIAATPIRELESFTFGDAASIFFTEAATQATHINPFSALNIGKTYFIVGALIVTVGAVVAYKITPKIPQ